MNNNLMCGLIEAGTSFMMTPYVVTRYYRAPEVILGRILFFIQEVNVITKPIVNTNLEEIQP